MKTFVAITILLTFVQANGDQLIHEENPGFNGTTYEARHHLNALKDLTIKSYMKEQSPLTTTPRSNKASSQLQSETTNQKKSSLLPRINLPETEDASYDQYEPEVYVQPKDKEDAFDWKLSQEVFKEQARTKANVIISPVSIKILITILAEAAGQDVGSATRNELMLALPFDRTLNGTRPYFKNILDSFEVPNKHYAVNVGTRGFVREGVLLRQKFTSEIEHNYKVNVVALDFGDTNKAAKSINGWVRDITNGKISNLVDPESLESCEMLLINAIYFKGVWKIPFERTISSEFYTTPTKTLRKDFVQQTDDYFYSYNADLKVRFLRLPYEGKSFSMFVILPFDKDGLSIVMEKLNATVIRDVVNNMHLMQVQVTLPKFKFESSMNLNQVIQNLGIKEIFEDSATFPNLQTNGRGIKVSNIIQKAGIIVDEKGSEAYAATEIDLVDKFGGDPREFLADHPFMFYIEDDTTGAKLFSGVINNPEFSI